MAEDRLRSNIIVLLQGTSSSASASQAEQDIAHVHVREGMTEQAKARDRGDRGAASG